jgi:hypothetical protein
MSNKSYFTIDVFNYIDEEENVEEYGERVYIDVRRLVNDILSDLKNHPTYKDHLIEVCGVKRWDYN